MKQQTGIQKIRSFFAQVGRRFDVDLNRKQLALLITIFTMAIVLLLTYNVHLINQEEDEYIIEMAFLNEELEQLIEEKERLEEMTANSLIKSHTAFNETTEHRVSQPEPLKSLEELLAEREMNEGDNAQFGDSLSYASTLEELVKKRQEVKEQLDERHSEEKVFTSNLKDRITSISYSLVNREALYLPPPIYTCERGGKVVINIRVDSEGTVIEASFNENSSNTNDYCLIENAKIYALRSNFNNSSKINQIGTITYLFQGK